MREFDRRRRLTRELLILSSTRVDNPHTSWAVDRLLAALEEHHLPAGAEVFRAGETPRSIFFMRSGEIELEWPGGPAYRLVNRWVFGALDVIAARPYRAGAVARTAVDLVTLDGERWLEIVEEAGELGQQFLVQLAADLARLQARLAPAGAFARPAGAATLPARPLRLIERALALEAVPLFARASAHAQLRLAQAAEEVVVDDARPLPAGERLWMVVDGEIEAAGKRFGPGDLVGGGAALAAPAEAQPLVPSRLLALPVEDFFAEMEEDFSVFRSAVSALADEREAALRELARRSAPQPLVLS